MEFYKIFIICFPSVVKALAKGAKFAKRDKETNIFYKKAFLCALRVFARKNALQKKEIF